MNCRVCPGSILRYLGLRETDPWNTTNSPRSLLAFFRGGQPYSASTTGLYRRRILVARRFGVLYLCGADSYSGDFGTRKASRHHVRFWEQGITGLQSGLLLLCLCYLDKPSFSQNCSRYPRDRRNAIGGQLLSDHKYCIFFVSLFIRDQPGLDPGCDWKIPIPGHIVGAVWNDRCLLLSIPFWIWRFRIFQSHFKRNPWGISDLRCYRCRGSRRCNNNIDQHQRKGNVLFI